MFMSMQTCMYCGVEVKDRPDLNTNEKTICAVCFVDRTANKSKAKKYVMSNPEEFGITLLEARHILNITLS